MQQTFHLRKSKGNLLYIDIKNDLTNLCNLHSNKVMSTPQTFDSVSLLY